ncbi:MAG: ribonuclease D [Rhodospirillales bacterium]|nr:ribonuclease D [Rhodospirillales bacterium]MSP79615.1 ribonuclease D [Rhodospirillales bacterium]
MKTKKPAVEVHRGDLPKGLDFGRAVAVDSESQGLHPHRDRLCMVQLSAGDGTAHLVHFPEPDFAAPNLKAVLADKRVTKIFHYARFDIGIIRQYLGVMPTPIYCTKIASRLVRTYTDRHGLKDLCKELLGIELSKEQQLSDWAAEKLSPAQVHYAAADVLHLHALKEKLDAMLAREDRARLAESCFTFLPVRAELDRAGFEAEDLFAHI